MKNRNHLALIQLKLLGFPLENIRRAMFALTGQTQTALAKETGFARNFITMIIANRRCNATARAAIAEKWEIPVEELFVPTKIHKQDAA